MKKSTILSIVVGIMLIGGVILKNVYFLNKRVEKDRNPFKLYTTENVELLMPVHLVEESDTNYLEDGSIFTIVKGVSGSIDSQGRHGTYALSIADYSAQLTDS